ISGSASWSRTSASESSSRRCSSRARPRRWWCGARWRTRRERTALRSRSDGRVTTSKTEFHRRLDRALSSERLRAALRRALPQLVEKSKSLATEEIGLTAHLEAQGIRAVETALGDWIIQLAGERPSHLIAPAIHKTREEVAQLFAKVVGHPVPDDTASLVQVARTELRQSFIDADIGITGGNALIAETGTLMLGTHEGNADLATTLPPVHIAVVGI